MVTKLKEKLPPVVFSANPLKADTPLMWTPGKILKVPLIGVCLHSTLPHPLTPYFWMYYFSLKDSNSLILK